VHYKLLLAKRNWPWTIARQRGFCQKATVSFGTHHQQ